MQAVIPVGIAYPQWLEDIRAVIRHELQYSQPVATAIPSAANDKPLTVREAAAFLDVTVQTCHEWKRRGLLKYHKIGSRTYFKPVDLQNALAGYQRTEKTGRGTNKKGQ